MIYKLKEFYNVKKLYRNLSIPILYEHSLKWNNVKINSTGALTILTGEKKGRSPEGKRIVSFEDCTENLWWNDNTNKTPNKEMSLYDYNINKEIAIKYLNTMDQLYIFEGFVGWDPKYRLSIRIISSKPYHLLFCKNMLIEANETELENFEPNYTLYNAGSKKSNYNKLTSALIAFNFKEKEILIMGTEYTGEIKKSIFTLMHYLMTLEGVLTLHSSVNIEDKYGNNPTIFFGLSGTGKTTLSSDPKRILIGDDEHCWTDDGIFNIEGGCYAKCINLDPIKEKDIFDTIKYGALLENIVINNDTRIVDYYNKSITPNTRVSYSVDMLRNVKLPCVCKHPKNIILLTCDYYGIMPLVSKLSLKQALYYFISGFTTKIPGTEDGINDPIPTFSSCYGEAFLPWHPWYYYQMLKEKIKKYNTSVWLVNTGWIGDNKKRIDIKISREIINNINSGELLKQEFVNTDIFNFKIPLKCGNLDNKILNPKNNWKDIKKYNKKLLELAKCFIINFNKFNEDDIFEDIKNIGPQI